MAVLKRMPTTFVPHGGGPWPVLKMKSMDAQETTALAGFMEAIREIPPERPRCLLVVSAHWEAEAFTVNAGIAPPMLYDYGGFPDEAYALRWPAPGNPHVAHQVQELLKNAGFAAETETVRGFDHGVFIPLMLAYPKAEVPVVQLSLRRGLDADEHLRVGQALAPLRDEGVFIVGSGNSFHNLRALLGRGVSLWGESAEFDEWLNETIRMDAKPRRARLRSWHEAPAARACHPREEHLIPLMVAAGAAGDAPGRVNWQGAMNGHRLSAHVFG